VLVNDFYETVNSHKFSRNNDDFYLGVIFWDTWYISTRCGCGGSQPWGGGD